MLEYLDVQPSPYADDLRAEHVDKGYIFLNGVITPGKVEVWMRELDKIRAEHDVVHFHLCSEGGELFPALAFYEYVNECKRANERLRTEISVYAFAASAASMLLLQMGDLRKMGRYGIIHTHSLQSESLPDGARRKLNRSITDILVARTGLPEKEVEELLDAEHYFTAEQALEKHLVDEIF